MTTLRVNALAAALAQRVGREKVAALIQGFVAGYAEAAARKAAGESLPDEVPIQVDVELGDDEDAARLAGELLEALLEVARWGLN